MSSKINMMHLYLYKLDPENLEKILQMDGYQQMDIIIDQVIVGETMK